MIDYAVLKILWWMILGAVLVVYACTAGFDAGVTIIMPFLKKETDRRIVLNTSAPTWDGNLTWIVFAGGGLFVVWPVVYSTSFSGMYPAMLCILYSFFLRPPGYEYRNKIDSHRWRRVWDMALLISGFVPVFIFGVATGNAFVGYPFHFDPHTFRIFYTGTFWQLLNPLGLMAGVVSVLMILMHGAAYMQRRTEDHLRHLAKKLHLIFSLLVLLVFTLSGLYLLYKVQGFRLVSAATNGTMYPLKNIVTRGTSFWLSSYAVYPWKYYGPVIAYAGILVSIWASWQRWLTLAFWASAFGIGGIIATAGFTLFPFIMPSSTNPNQSITVWNADSSQYALNIMLYVGVILLLIILAYKIFAYHSIWSQKPTITEQDLKENEHTFY